MHTCVRHDSDQILILATQSVGPGPAALALPGSLLDMQNCRPHRHPSGQSLLHKTPGDPRAGYSRECRRGTRGGCSEPRSRRLVPGVGLGRLPGASASLVTQPVLGGPALHPTRRAFPAPSVHWQGEETSPRSQSRSLMRPRHQMPQPGHSPVTLLLCASTYPPANRHRDLRPTCLPQQWEYTL